LPELKELMKEYGFKEDFHDFWRYTTKNGAIFIVEVGFFRDFKGLHVSTFSRENGHENGNPFEGIEVLDKLLTIAEKITGYPRIFGCDYGYYYYKEVCRKVGWKFNYDFPPIIERG